MERRLKVLEILTALLAVGLLFSGVALAAGPVGPSVSIVPSENVVSRGDTFSVDV